MGEPTIESLILIAPNARVDRSKRFDSDRVVKADQFLTALQKNLDNASIFSLIGGFAKATFSEPITEIAKKLIRLHRPISIDYAAKFGLADTPVSPVVRSEGMANQFGNSALSNPVAAPAVQPSPVTPSYLCRKCQSADISINYGKFGYYFKCDSCDGNTPIKLDCGRDGHKERLRKSGHLFYRECAECQSSSVYFTNPQKERCGT